jgi:hypothetical protein
MVFYDTNA